MVVAVYVRQSLDRSGDGLAIDRQESACRALADRFGLTVDRVYRDNDVSATNGKRRPGFERLLSDRPEVVIVWHQDRLLRVSRDLERVLDAGFTVHMVTAGTLDLATPTGRAVARTVTAWSTFESEHKAARQRAANAQKAAAGRPMWAHAFGYNLDGSLTADADLVRAGYRWLLEGVSRSEIARRWDAAASVSPLGNRWSDQSVRAVLRAPRNAGLQVYRGEIIGRGMWVPIVDEPVFYAAQAAMTPRTRRTWNGGSRRALLTGAMECGQCGRRMTSGWYAAGGKKVRVYRCPYLCVGVNAEQVEGWILEALQMLTEPETRDAGPKFRRLATTPEVARLSAQASALRERLEEVEAGYARGEISYAVFRAAAADLELRTAQNLSEIQRTLEEQGPAYSGPSAWSDMSHDERRAFIQARLAVRVLKVGRGRRRGRDSVEITERSGSNDRLAAERA